MEKSPSEETNQKSQKPDQKAPPKGVSKENKGQSEAEANETIKETAKQVKKENENKPPSNPVDNKPIATPIVNPKESLTPNPPTAANNPAPPAAAEPVGMVEMGGGLPALPPRPAAPVRQAIPSASASSINLVIPQRVPNLKQVSKPQFNVPPGSDLGTVGKIGVYQMSHKSSATDIHANLFFWVYIITLITTYVLIKKK